MELKLQQAIVATRAGRTDVAQHLLTQLIHEKPDEANAWFLLGHIVDSPKRQSNYLKRTVELDPDNVIAKQRLEQLENPPIPAPVISQPDVDDTAEAIENAEASPDSSAIEAEPGVTSETELPEWLQDLDDKQLGAQPRHDEAWQKPAGMPIRETQKSPQPTAAVPVSQNTPDSEPESSNTSREVWLVRILVIMVIVAAIILGILVLLILI
jgi:hypothetical protein